MRALRLFYHTFLRWLYSVPREMPAPYTGGRDQALYYGSCVLAVALLWIAGSLAWQRFGLTPAERAERTRARSESQRSAERASREMSMVGDARVAVRNELRDPSSAEFSGGRVFYPDGYDGSPAVCGMVNARNGFGGMTGKQLYIVHNGLVRVDGVGETRHKLFMRAFDRLCETRESAPGESSAGRD